jgi:GTP-binding protein
MLESLNERCKGSLSLQAIITKVDAIPSADVSKVIAKMRTQITEAAPMCLPAILTSANMRPSFGIEEVRKSIVEACDLK